MKTKFLITGGTGNIGSFLIKEILSKGYSVNFLTRSRKKIKKSTTLNGFFWDIDKKIIDDKCFDGVTHIVHLSGESISKRWTKKRKRKILSSRLLTTNLLFSSLSKRRHFSKLQHIVCASAIGIYESSFNEIYDEDSICEGKSYLQNVVIKWEKELLNFSFDFLLERETNTSILASFDLTVISKYFPEYTKKVDDKFNV